MAEKAASVSAVNCVQSDFLEFVNVCLFCCSLHLVRVLIVMTMERWSEFSACTACQAVRLHSIVETAVMSGKVACCSLLCGTLVGLSMFSIMCSKLLIMSGIS